jgi:hypothetical protein
VPAGWLDAGLTSARRARRVPFVCAEVVRAALGDGAAVTGTDCAEPAVGPPSWATPRVSDQILLKPGPLTPAERELVHLHPSIGAQILRNVSMLQGPGLDVVRHHHERWDGAGYPDDLLCERFRWARASSPWPTRWTQ